MFTYTQTKDFARSKVKTTAKADIMEMLKEFFSEKFGAEKVRMVRTGNQSKSNDLAIQFGEVDVDGEKLPMTFTINPVVKDYVDGKTAKTSYVAFDFEGAADAYDAHIAQQAEKAAKAKASK